jgi:tetraacyldisaccharide 4'-kinase
MARWLQRQWYRLSLWHLVLWPVSLIFRLLVAVRRWLYRIGLLVSVRLPVPVLVVGNITVGGTGKTPLVLWLAELLRQQGYRPGIISRGYGGREGAPESVSAASDPALVGDEPVLLAKRLRCPVWVGADRVEVARALLRARPDCDILISDDGLQHYRLQRDVELVVVDGVRRFGNGACLPAGPLREPLGRLRLVDAVVVNGGAVASGEYAMQLNGFVFRQLRDESREAGLQEFLGQRIDAVAGIGNPARFFDTLRQLGLDVTEHPFPDHHAYQPDDLQYADTVIMTEKDAVKCSAFAPENSWYLAVDAEVDTALASHLLEILNSAALKRLEHGRKTA